MKYFSISIFNRGLGDNIMAYAYFKSLSEYCKKNNKFSLIYVKSDLEIEISKIFNLENIKFKKIGYSPKLDYLNNIKPFINNIYFLFDLIIFKKTEYLTFLDTSKSKIISFICMFFKKSHIIGSSKSLNNNFDIKINIDENTHLSKTLIKFLPNEVNPIFTNFNFNNITYNFSNKFQNNNYIVFAPGSGELEKHKRWPENYYTKLSNFLESNSYKLVLIGSINEEKLLDNIIKNSNNKNIYKFIPKNLYESLSLFKYSRLVVGGDSGNLHLANIVNENILAIWGPTNKLKTAPLSKKIQFIDLNLSCGPCYNRYRTGCGNNVCMQDIQPELVYKIIKNKL